MYIKPTEHIHTDGKRKSLKGVGAGAGDLPRLILHDEHKPRNSYRKRKNENRQTSKLFSSPAANWMPPPRGEGEGAQRDKIKQY